MAALTTGGTCFATGYVGPGDYIVSSRPSVENSPEFFWEWEVKRLAKEFHPREKLRRADDNEYEDRSEANERSRKDADIADFAAALKEGRIKPLHPDEATEQNKDFGSCDDSDGLTEFDSEFADYHRGASAYHDGKTSEARKAWEALLNRPAKNRHYRSVWASYMLGKLAMKNADYPAAVNWFEKTRALAKDGFADALGLAADSYGWEGRCEWKQDHPEKAAPLWLTQLALGDESAVISLKALIPDREPTGGGLDFGPDKTFVGEDGLNEQQKLAAKRQAKEGLKTAAADPLLRRLVTAHVLATESSSSASDYDGSGPDKRPTRSARWLAAIKEAKIDHLEDAEYLGWVAYINGAYEDAEHWLKLAKSGTPASNWLRAKLQLRAGKLEDAEKSMQRACQAVTKPGAYTGQPGQDIDAEESFFGNLSFPGSAACDLGLIYLARGEYLQAMDSFLQGGYWGGAAYVAERVLSADELRAYVDGKPGTFRKADARPKDLEKLRSLLGRRLVREDRYADAARYLKPPYDKLLECYVQALKDGANEKLPKEQRANGWFTAAWLAQYDGDELMKNDVVIERVEGDNSKDPAMAQYPLLAKPGVIVYQNKYVDGTFPYPVTLAPTTDEWRRVAEHKIAPESTEYSSIIAVALAEKGARFLDDNTEELADVLNSVSNWVYWRVGKKYNEHFFDLLEKRCPNTAIGKAAMAKHSDFTSGVPVEKADSPWQRKQSAACKALHQKLGIPYSEE